MKDFVFFIILLCLFNCCTSKYSKDNHRATFEIGNDLYNERFKIHHWLGDNYSEYITDSINFRKHIGTYDDNLEWFVYKINGQFLDVYQEIAYVMESESGKPFRAWTAYDTTKIASHNIDELKREGKFEKR